MATIRESLKKLVEVAKPVPGDEQEFVAKHGMKIMDFQGKDSLSTESPYDHILKNVAAVKAPPHGSDDHGHDAPGESERAYHIPESRDAKIAKLSEMMGKDEDEDEEEDDEDEKEVKEAKKQVVGVEMHYTHPTKKPFKITHFSVKDAERGRKEYEKMGYKLAGKKAQVAEASLPLLPKQKELARSLLKKEMEDNKKKRNDNRQAGTPRISESEEDNRMQNDKAREERIATPRPTAPATVEGMRHRLQVVKKQIIDKT